MLTSIEFGILSAVRLLHRVMASSRDFGGYLTWGATLWGGGLLHEVGEVCHKEGYSMWEPWGGRLTVFMLTSMEFGILSAVRLLHCVIASSRDWNLLSS